MCTYTQPKSTKPRQNARKCVLTYALSPQNRDEVRAFVDLHPTQVHKREVKLRQMFYLSEEESKSRTKDIVEGWFGVRNRRKNAGGAEIKSVEPDLDSASEGKHYDNRQQCSNN